MHLAHLGFAPCYETDVDPEFPASGNWGIAEFRFGLRSGRGNFRSGDTLVIRVRPAASEAWIGSFGVDARAGSVGLYACPSPNDLLVVTGTDAYLIDVRYPSQAENLPVKPIRFVHRPPATKLLVIGSWIKLAAIDVTGLRWVTGRLLLDDLDLIETSQERVVVGGAIRAIPNDRHVLTIDIDTGDLIDGPVYTDFMHPHGEAAWRRSDV